MTKQVTRIPQPGDESPDVGVLQDAINGTITQYPPLTVDNKFGPKTRAELSKFQKANGLEGTGIPGVKTMALLGIKVVEAPVPVPSVEGLPWDSMVGVDASDYLVSRLYEIYDSHIVKIKDGAKIHPQWASLTKDQQISVLAAFWVQVAKHESGWNPKSASVDVGTKGKRDTWSIGLFQISVVDQSWAKPRDKAKYTYEELLTPIPNIDLTIAIFKRQIDKEGLVFLKNSSKYRYWAVILEGGKYSKIAAITNVTKKITFKEAEKDSKNDLEDGVLTREIIADTIVGLIENDVKAELRETHGKNRSPRIDSFNKRAKAYLGAPYCASGGWCAIDDACTVLGLKNPVPPTASSQAFRKSSFVPQKYIRPEGSKGRKGDVGVLQQVADPSLGHYVTLSEDQGDSQFFETVEYNTDATTGDRDGDGAYAMRRSTVDRSAENAGKIFVCFTDVPQWILDFNS